MQKITVIVLLVALLLSAGCTESGSGESTSAEQAVAETFEITIGLITPEADAMTQSCYYFEKELEAATEGRVQVEVIAGGALGSGADIFDQVQKGQIEMCINAYATFAPFSETFYVYNLPYLFPDLEVAYEFLDGEIAAELNRSIESQGFKVLASYDNGFRNLTNNIRPVKTPADVEGLSIRTMTNAVHMELFNQLGANPTPLSYGEVFTALQTNTVDGQENSFNNTANMKFNEVSKYMTETRHAYDPAAMFMNIDTFNSYPADIQKAVEEAAYNSGIHNRELTQKNTAISIEEIKATTELITLTDEERAAFREAAAGTYDVFREQIGADFIDQVMAEIDRIAAARQQ